MQNKIKKISGILLVAIILCLPNFVFANSIIKEKVKTLSNDNVFAYYNYYGTENPKDPYSNEDPKDPYSNEDPKDPYSNEDPKDPYSNEDPKDPYSNENSNDVYDNSEHNYRKSETPKTGDKISINTYIIISLLSIIALSVAGEMAKRNIIK
ncbi:MULTISPECIES: hypothetical protein [Anaerofustis]|uniref:hypothetical protein n=1 Tax=Anaerofustis TaxID=264995 RepID=UPI0011061BB9|nr:MULTISPECIES: hypothetical protein [Anaerofustis]MCO8194675.1 hypothetical protein [Anaerofustis sp. NSJ-163]